MAPGPGGPPVDALALVHARIRAQVGTHGGPFLVPEFLAGGSRANRMVDVGDAYSFFDRTIAGIHALGAAGPAPVPRRGIDARDRVYLAFPRTFAALDARVGTALSQLALLPYLRDRLGVSVFVCLPTGVIGTTARKGRRGSPFAVRNPFDIDPAFADPLLGDLSALTQYQALVRACRLLGMRAGAVVPLATLGIDSPIFRSLPSLGFWWTAAPGERVHADARTVPADPSATTAHQPVALEASTMARFVRAPHAGDVTVVSAPAGDYAVSTDGSRTLANAFPDVLAGDSATYTWSDVAFVRYTHRKAPGPAGVADPTANLGTTPAWTLMPAVVAWRHHVLGEDVFLVDVAPSVPDGVLRRSRLLASAWRDSFGAALADLGAGRLSPPDAGRLLGQIRAAMTAAAAAGPTDTSARSGSPVSPSLTFIAEELWSFHRRSIEYDAVTGPLAFCVSAHSRHPAMMVESLRRHLHALHARPPTGPHLAAVANHDTMPPLPDTAALLWICYTFLPAAVPMFFAGTEWGSTEIVNKEFGFDSSEQLLDLRGRLGEGGLALFEDRPVDWSALGAPDDTDGVNLPRVLADLRALHSRLNGLDGWTFRVSEPHSTEPESCFGYVRRPPSGRGALCALFNWGYRDAVLRWPHASAEVIVKVRARQVPRTLRRHAEILLGPGSALVTITTAISRQFPV